MDYPKVTQEINNIVEDNVKLLAQLFPAAVKDGQVDFEALKEEIGQFEEVGKEKYEFTWAGKQDAKKKAQEDVYNRTLKYIESDSKNPETTENLYIEGDNLEVLKLLRQNYYGAIKMIYIDPPYNTGNDFVYNDNFTMGVKESDISEGTRDDEGNPLQKNQQSSNRYHANWINMMYPRLKTAKDLLTDDGVIFISIDDNEVENLKKICNEIFGESNYIDTLHWKRKKQPSFLAKHTAKVMEYVIIYGKCKECVDKLSIENISDGTKKVVNLTNNISVRRFKAGVRVKLGENGVIAKGVYTIKSMQVEYLSDVYYKNGLTENEVEVKAQFSVSQDLVDKFIEENLLFITINYGLRRDVSVEEQNNKKAITDLLLDWGDNQDSEKEQQELLNGKYFDYTKPTKLLLNISKSITFGDDIILDFFSGSATTAHAVMQLNAEDGGNRKFIMVQVPEVTDENSEAKKAGYDNICEIGKERIRRAGEKIKQEIETANAQLKIGEEPKQVPDIGFKVFRTADTNIKWNLYDELGQLDTSAMTHTPDLADFTMGFSDIDVVYEVMLRQKDVPLSATLEILTDISSRTYLYGSAYLVCLETEITEKLIDKLAALDPLPIKFVFRDSAFKDDINMKDETFRRLKNLIERNSGLAKKTYTVEFI